MSYKLTSHTLTNWGGTEVESPALPERFAAEANLHPTAAWFISEASFEVNHESGCDYGDSLRDDYGTGPWTETSIVTHRVYEDGKSSKPEPVAHLMASLLDDDGDDLMEIELTGQEAIDFIGWEAIEEAAKGNCW